MSLLFFTPLHSERGEMARGNHIRILMHPEMDEELMHKFLKDNNCRLIVRPHWITQPHQYSSDRIQTISHAEQPDLYNLFSVSDILVTDYSSAFIDWLILDKPVIFTPYDLEEYERKKRIVGKKYQKLVPQTNMADLPMRF
jgi:CDP-glycerol glycerophosphotransferase